MLYKPQGSSQEKKTSLSQVHSSLFFQSMVWWLLWLRLLSFLLTFSLNWHGAIAQSNASCLPFYNWTFNSVHQSPCQVASSLLAVCNGGSFPVPALPDASHYEGPSLQNANPCQCNSVTYSLMSACGACQGDIYLSWSVWSENCHTVYLSSYPEPIPSGVFVPGWAYLDVQANDNFDQFLARTNANLTQSTAVPSPTSTKPPMTILSTSSSATLSQSTSTPSSPLTSNTFISRANAVGEGVVGGILGLFVLCALLYGYFQWKKRLARNKEALLPRTDTENPQAAVSEVIEKPFTMAQVRGVTPPVLTFNYSLVSTPVLPPLSSARLSSALTAPTEHPRIQI